MPESSVGSSKWVPGERPDRSLHLTAPPGSARVFGFPRPVPPVNFVVTPQTRGSAMPILFQCPGCKKNLKTKDELAGKRIKCPGCGEHVPVPAARVGPGPRGAAQGPA